ncbi:hypothetical protein [Halovivax limisalsi]|uniref:hypothetical protein n=1 Tax=Halovivax limisalsi TaxID=1453760 RepID=UPI001FFCA8A3|nr:hypothetical protein [Halovivax limisalsi]
MNRRSFFGVTALPFLSGCMLFRDDERVARSSVDIDRRLCNDTDDTVDAQMGERRKTIHFTGVMSAVSADDGLRSYAYLPTSEDDRRIICDVIALKTDDVETGRCEGAVKYSGRITLDGVSVDSIRFIHNNGEESYMVNKVSV